MRTTTTQSTPPPPSTQAVLSPPALPLHDPSPRRTNSSRGHPRPNQSEFSRFTDDDSELSDTGSSMRQMAGRAAKTPLSWAMTAAEQFANTTAKVGITTASILSTTATALSSTTELAASVMARKTASVALNTASVASQTATLAATRTSHLSESAGVAVAATATTMVDGISHLSLNSHQSPKSSSMARSGPSRKFAASEDPLILTTTSPVLSPSLMESAPGGGLSQTPEAFTLGTSTLPSKDETLSSSIKSVSMRLWAMLGATNEAARRQWITNATSSRPTPPSAKYLRKILTMAWETKGETVDEFFLMLVQRPVGTDAFCALKALTVSLRLVREGPPEALRTAIKHVRVIDAIGATWAERVLVVQQDDPLKKKDEIGLHEQLLIARLSAFIVQKLHFHAKASHYNALYESSETSTPVVGATERWESMLETAPALLTLLGTIEGVARLALAGAEVPPVSLALAVVLTEEAAGAFVALSAVMATLLAEANKSAGDALVVKLLAKRTSEAYEGLRLYFGMAQSFGYIAALKTVPQFTSTVIASRPYTKSDILTALEHEEAIQSRLGRSDDMRQADSTEPSDRATLPPHAEEEEEEQDREAETSLKARNETTANPFDTGNSSLILLAEAHGSTNVFENISNPFLSGMSTFASALPGVRNSGLRRSGMERDQDATARALDQCVRSFEFSGVMLGADAVTVSKDVIGRGAFSVVYRGRLVATGAEVAVKELQLQEWGRSPEMVLDFRAEVALMKAVHHPNVLQLIGAQTLPTLRLISELCSRGNLLDLLFLDRQSSPDESRTLTWALRLRLALGEARGVSFLHNAFPAPLIHRDLKSPNLLLSKQWTLKVSDFGLSRFMGRINSQQGPCGTTQWMAPEVIEGKVYDELSDVFSFGVNLWELVTRRIPWEGVDVDQIRKAVVKGQRLNLDSIEKGCPPALVDLMQRCWQPDSTKRPKFTDIVRELKVLEEAA